MKSIKGIEIIDTFVLAKLWNRDAYRRWKGKPYEPVPYYHTCRGGENGKKNDKGTCGKRL